MKTLIDYIDEIYIQAFEGCEKIPKYIDGEYTRRDIEYDLYDSIGDAIVNDEQKNADELLELLDNTYNSGKLNVYADSLWNKYHREIAEDKKLKMQYEREYWEVQR